LLLRLTPRSPRFPYTTLFRSDGRAGKADEGCVWQGIAHVLGEAIGDFAGLRVHLGFEAVLTAVRFIRDDDHIAPRGERLCDLAEDRKSTRLNSSHVKISYAVF